MMVMRVVGKEEGEGGKAMAMVTMMAGERRATLTKRVMATKMREAGRGSKSNGDGEEDCIDKQQQQQPQQRQQQQQRQ
jgi:hypothetical protein